MDLNYKDPKRWAFTMQTNVVMTRDPRTASWSELFLDLNTFPVRDQPISVLGSLVMTEAELFKAESNLEDAKIKIFERSIQSSR